jgi:hypothetical protein
MVDLLEGEQEFLELAIMADLRHSGALLYSKELIGIFIEENYFSLESINSIIEQFELLHENEFSRTL